MHEQQYPERVEGSEPRPRLVYITPALGFLTVLIDGFDTQSVAFAGPFLKREFASGGSALGMIFGLGMTGGLIGAFVLGPLGDKFGRRPLIIASLLLMAIGSILSAYASTVMEVAIFRLLAGIGFGGAVPTVLALVAECAAPKRRSLTIAIVFNGFPLGGMLGSIVGAQFLPAHGWRAFFTLGAVLPAVLLMLVVFLLPESRQVLARTEARRAVRSEQTCPGEHSDAVEGGFLQRFGQLFAGDLRHITVLLWLGTFLSVLSLYCTVNFLPTLMSEAGIPMGTAIRSIAALNLGSVIGGIILARFADRSSPYLPTAVFYMLGGLTLAAIAAPIYSSAAILSLAFLGGLLAFGAQLSLTAITTRAYPVPVKSTGIGFSHGVARIGGAVGPFVAGILLDLGGGFAMFMTGIGVMFVLAGVVVLMLRHVAPVRFGA